MEDNDKFKKAINNLISNPETWVKIKQILKDDIKDKEDLINYLDRLVQEREDNISKLN
jgi:hypothetical protein